ncbi:MAG: DUF421 domain-containing protein [Oscillospiraceae bacterium]|nr:DUF421 domain-containing protein [Oscillospiraceae bacterium]
MLVLFLRTILVYMFVIAAIRIMGKRQLGELQPNELVVTILISNIATLSLQDNGMPLIGTLLPIFTLVACEVIISFTSLKSLWVRRAVTGNPIIIIRDGIVQQHEMQKLRWTVDDLLEQLRTGGHFDLSEIAFAVVETSGMMSVYPKFPYRQVNAKDMSLTTQDQHCDAPPVVLIRDGNISQDGLAYCGVDRIWLDDTLRNESCTPRTVFIMTCDRNRKYHLVKRDEKFI